MAKSEISPQSYRNILDMSDVALPINTLNSCAKVARYVLQNVCGQDSPTAEQVAAYEGELSNRGYSGDCTELRRQDTRWFWRGWRQKYIVVVDSNLLPPCEAIPPRSAAPEIKAETKQGLPAPTVAAPVEAKQAVPQAVAPAPAAPAQVAVPVTPATTHVKKQCPNGQRYSDTQDKCVGKKISAKKEECPAGQFYDDSSRKCVKP